MASYTYNPVARRDLNRITRLERSTSSRYDRVSDSRSGARSISLDSTYEASIQSPWTYKRVGRRRRRTLDFDTDYFKFEVKAGKTYSLDINPIYLSQGRYAISGSKGVINLDNNSLAMGSLRRGSKLTSTFTATADETLYLSFGGQHLSRGSYRFVVNDLTPDPTPNGSALAPKVDRSLVTTATTYTSDVTLTDTYEGKQPSLHAIRGTQVNLKGDVSLNTDISVKSHGPLYAKYDYTIWDMTFGRGGYGGGCPAWGLRNAQLIGDAGAQTLNIKSKTTSITDQVVRSYGFDQSTVDLGDGDNVINIQTKATSGTDYTYRRWNWLWEKAPTYQPIHAYGEAYTYGSISSTVTTGTGNDVINISTYSDQDNQTSAPHREFLEKAKSNGFGFHTSSLLTGDGDDTVNISALSQGRTIRRYGSYRRPGQMRGTRQAYYLKYHDDVAVYNSTIDVGNGNDNVVLTTNKYRRVGLYTHNEGTALEGSTINLGAGNDSLTMTGRVRNSTINGGEGYDQVTFTASDVTNWKQLKSLQAGESLALPWANNVVLNGVEEIRIASQSYNRYSGYKTVYTTFLNDLSDVRIYDGKDPLPYSTFYLRKDGAINVGKNLKYNRDVRWHSHTNSFRTHRDLDFWDRGVRAYDFKRRMYTSDANYNWDERAEKAGVRTYRSWVTVQDATATVGDAFVFQVDRKGNTTKGSFQYTWTSDDGATDPITGIVSFAQGQKSQTLEIDATASGTLTLGEFQWDRADHKHWIFISPDDMVAEGTAIPSLEPLEEELLELDSLTGEELELDALDDLDAIDDTDDVELDSLETDSTEDITDVTAPSVESEVITPITEETSIETDSILSATGTTEDEAIAEVLALVNTEVD